MSAEGTSPPCVKTRPCGPYEPADPSERVASPERRVALNEAWILRNADRPILIAGNGPSLRSVDHTRIPADALILRVNNFFLEDRYHLGDHADLVFISGHKKVVPTTAHTLLTALDRGEYTSYVYLAWQDVALRLSSSFLPVVDARRALLNHKTIADYMALRAMPPGIFPTTGILAILAAVAYGFRDIYVAGIDFYQGEARYAHKVGPTQAGMAKLPPSSVGYHEKAHSLDVDMAGLDLARRCEGVSIRSVCPESSAARVLDLAPSLGSAWIEPRDKPPGCVTDLLPIPKVAFSGPMSRRWSRGWWISKTHEAKMRLGFGR